MWWSDGKWREIHVQQKQWGIMRGWCFWFLVYGCLPQWDDSFFFPEERLRAARWWNAKPNKRVWETFLQCSDMETLARWSLKKVMLMLASIAFNGLRHLFSFAIIKVVPRVYKAPNFSSWKLKKVWVVTIQTKETKDLAFDALPLKTIAG